MREIKFRGLRKDGKRWVYGFPYSSMYDEYIDQIVEWDCHHDVDPSSVGQFTGLKNKRGREIYEGDIVMYSEKNTPLVVGFENGSFVLKKDGKTYVYNINPKELEVIGNIHENNN